MAKGFTDRPWDTMSRRCWRCSMPNWGGDRYGTIQRVRFSPTETMLAITVKKDHHEETRCVLVHLGGVILCQKALLLLDNVLSFEWATDDVLYYSTQETLRCLFFVEVSHSRDQRLVTINCSSKISSEVWFFDSKTPFSFPTSPVSMDCFTL
ncbi:prolyl endopeptidase-like isoform X2 [Sinocyclocheilus grahami]|uniref:prolyl endopeptidase-like isoform X2 n=1 Tax=Sinocyclocheilus grahami TaxID=75366 RepID=UPI0007ACCD43|nr:PREDICTED: prolyl endopeptidase-like isoform X2 [Sinocyclocheilus grahami]